MDNLFEWNPKKAESNFKKHGIKFEEAATVFFDPLSLTVLVRCIQLMKIVLSLPDFQISKDNWLSFTPTEMIK